MARAIPDLRRLRHFIAVADAGGFTRAAEALHLSQQALSSSVQQLEKELDAKLFERVGRQVSLTRAGRLLLAEGQTLLAAAHTVADHVHRVAADTEAVFVVGHTPALSSAEVYTLMEPAIAAFTDTSFTFRQMFPDVLVAGLLDGSVHLGLRRGVVPPSNLAGAVIGYDRVRVAVPADHRLATRRKVDIHDLVSERIALWAPPGASYYSDFLMSACRRAGFEPGYVVSRVQGAATVAAPLTTGAVGFVTAPAGPAMGGRVTVVDLVPVLHVPVQALWQRHTSSAVRDAVVTPDK
ncbi:MULTISPECIES: LysR family transcriptional regulator [unclassified Mycobacterium]|uniref:LysR family transcriptional regulator n=1 Tax=unclassified Mycobacterium TaxID=2642494 RepID=UPI00074052FF|nr:MULTISPECIES: LysR family transcriptional regulator [unclassified Mycobacterium]KUH83868.1 transcriptional regulator [Mycobacterium sp. IS-1556]KUH88453.1 transcriptional regulator [Mycobacterium sp. GA-0227b]KUH89657.1 transcriptional regulator [Mycobacterium sp. GA-1999]